MIKFGAELTFLVLIGIPVLIIFFAMILAAF